MGVTRIVFPKFRGLLMRVWFGMVELDRLENNASDEVADFGWERVDFRSSFFKLLFRELWLIMMMVMALHLIR